MSAIDGAVSGTVLDPQGVAVSGAKVRLLATGGKGVLEATTSATGEFQIFPVVFGEYEVVVDASAQAPGTAPYRSRLSVGSSGTTEADVRLEPAATGKELVVEVKAKKQLIQKNASESSTRITQEQIAQLPRGNQVSLPRLLETTTPGVVLGPFNQLFIRGNHASVQYQIDGIQMPDSTTGSFAEAFSPRNIDHFELITGGIPAEFGERLAAVMNIVTKTGPETPGGSVDLSYGSYDNFSPQASYGGSNAAGDLHYYLSANYHRTDRGIDTPQPRSTADNSQGGKEAVHDGSHGDNEFAKVDWLLDNSNKLSLILFHSYNRYEIPNFPASFDPHDPYFDRSSGFQDRFGNSGFNYRLPGTDDVQLNRDAYAQTVWKHTFSERSFLQIAPYWKYSSVRVDNDPANDLAPGDPSNAAYFNPGNEATSFSLNHHVNNEGLKVDYSLRSNDRSWIKAGLQLQATQSHDAYGVSSWAPNDADVQTLSSFSGGNDNKGYQESFYVQDDYQLAKPLSLNVGLRFTAIQYRFSQASTDDSQWQPRVGLNYMATETTKLHLFYGRLFTPAPLEDLRVAFSQVNGATTPSFYDVKAEKNNYYELGVDQQLAQSQLATMNVYYRTATDMLDESQLLNTSISSPYNYAQGYGYGVELSLRGKLGANWSDYVTYSYQVAKGKGISGGTFAADAGEIPADSYIYLDHIQVHTANAGLTYSTDDYYATAQSVFGSGLRSGEGNSDSLPSHVTFDLSAGYELKGGSWLSRWKLSGDVLNVLDNVYPITIANAFNGSHYAPGRQFFVRVSKEF